VKGGRGEKKGGREKVGVFGQETFTSDTPRRVIGKKPIVLWRVAREGGNGGKARTSRGGLIDGGSSRPVAANVRIH